MERNCRMCLVENKRNQFQDFELKLEDNLSVYDYYKLLTSVNLRYQDERTKSKICHKCLQKLLFFYKDRCQAITNNEIMSKWCNEENISIDPQEITIVKEETEISSEQNPVDPLFNFIDIENVKLEADLLNFENAEKVEPTSDVESSSIVQENWESETKPCNVSLERCKVVSIRYKNEVVSDGTINSVQDTSENKKTKLPAKKIVKNPSEICEICGINVNNGKMKHHLDSVHLQIKRFFCDICTNGYYVENDLKRHKVSHEHPTIPCTHEGCDKMFSSQYRLRAHIRGCHYDRNATIPCTYPNCVKLFALKSRLIFHIRYTHLKERSHICPICEKGFFTSNACNEHIKTHDEKKCICDLCGNVFCSKASTILHIRRFHLLSSLVCSFCGMKFGQYRNSELKMHELDHQNIKPHPCEICLKPFKLNALKTEHIRALHFKSKIKCEVCGKKFIRLGKYRNHAKENHADLGAEKIEEWVARIKRMRPDYEKLEWVYD